MYRRACPVLLVALAIGLVITRHRLSDAQAELRLLRLTLRTHERARSEAVMAPGAAVPTSRVQPVAPAEGPAVPPASDFSEWEQAVPPMDS
jgi:hypothetical protein